MVRSRSSSPDDDRYVTKSNRRSNSRERERSYKYSHRDDARYHNNRRSRSRSPLKQTTRSRSRSPKHHLTKPGSQDYHRENGHSSHHGHHQPHHHQQQGHANNKMKVPVPDFFDRYVVIYIYTCIFFIMSHVLYEINIFTGVASSEFMSKGHFHLYRNMTIKM